MGWMSRFLAPAATARAAPCDETVVNGARYDAGNASPGNLEKPAASGDLPDAPLAEEIKRRQISLAVRYVVAVRACHGARFWQPLR
jgi:hypothetical protein